MKKIISVLLSVVMVCAIIVPAFAEGSHTVSFVGPSESYRNETDPDGNPIGDAYCFVKPADPNDESKGMGYVEDENGEYVIYNNRYILLSGVSEYYLDKVSAERYRLDTYSPDNTFQDGDILVFFVHTGVKYNASTVNVLINETKQEPSQYGAYRVKVDKDLSVRVIETSASGNQGLERSHFNVKLISGEGYNVRPAQGESYHYTFYGDSFSFRIHVKRGYNASGMKVNLIRNADLESSGTIDKIGNILGKNEVLQSTGTDSDGYRTYTVKNVTSDCKIMVSGVKTEKKSDILSIFKRILKRILAYFGVELDILGDFMDEYTVTINNTAGDDVTYEMLTSEGANVSSVIVENGNGVAFMVTKKDKDRVVNVTWEGMNDDGYSPVWTSKIDGATGDTVYTAIYNIDNVTSDMTIEIS